MKAEKLCSVTEMIRIRGYVFSLIKDWTFLVRGSHFSVMKIMTRQKNKVQHGGNAGPVLCAREAGTGRFSQGQGFTT